MRFRTVLSAFVWASACAFAQDYGAPGTFQVSVTDRCWTDASRQNREIPVRIYAPTEYPARLPIIVFSHGLGGSREGYAYFGQHMASHGYLSVHVQHHGSDGPAIRAAVQAGEAPTEAFRKAATNLQNAIDRPKNVCFVLDQLAEEDKAGHELAGRLDMDHIAVAGHSFGGFTAMACAGQGDGLFRDQRIRSAIAMSAPAPKIGTGYASITIPVLVMTGTLDDSPVLGGTAQSRLQAFEQMSRNERYLVVFTGGDHMIFSGRSDALAALNLRGMAGERKLDPQFQRHIKAISLAFLEHTLRQDAKAERWLTGADGAKASLGDMATWTVRRP
jgi:predicted dienelactone hydrolase